MTGLLMLATLASLTAWIASLKRVLRPAGYERRITRSAVLLSTLCSLIVFILRVSDHAWAPLRSHLDGVSLLSTLFGLAIIYLQWTRRIPGVALFALPLLLLTQLWGVCASWWTFDLFEVNSVWKTIHLLSIYVGLLSAGTAAAASGLWLYTNRQMRSKQRLAVRFQILSRLGSLETIERTIVRQATVAFVLITLAMVTGLVSVQPGSVTSIEYTTPWWQWPKTWLSIATWLIFATVMHIRHLPRFRGRRAALFMIVGFIVLIIILSITLSMSGGH